MKYEEDKGIEEAIKFLVSSINESGNNPKPVIIHSIRVGMLLYNLNYSKDIIIGGILHDILEDTAVTPDEIKEKFGDKGAQLVQACSFDKSIDDKKDQYVEATERCSNAGKEALIIKSADFIDNIPYTLNKSPENINYDFLYAKTKHFIDTAKQIIFEEPIFKQLEEIFSKN